MTKVFKEIDVVALTCDLPEHGLSAGDEGTVVWVHRESAAYEVEFVDDEGYTTAVVTLEPERIKEVWRFRPEAAE